jgi:hypothetical protein
VDALFDAHREQQVRVDADALPALTMEQMDQLGQDPLICWSDELVAIQGGRRCRLELFAAVDAGSSRSFRGRTGCLVWMTDAC